MELRELVILAWFNGRISWRLAHKIWRGEIRTTKAHLARLAGVPIALAFNEPVRPLRLFAKTPRA
jgi:hypothetical protein